MPLSSDDILKVPDIVQLELSDNPSNVQSGLSQLRVPTSHPWRWMDELGFYVPSTVFQSFWDDDPWR